VGRIAGWDGVTDEAEAFGSVEGDISLLFWQTHPTRHTPETRLAAAMLRLALIDMLSARLEPRVIHGMRAAEARKWLLADRGLYCGADICGVLGVDRQAMLAAVRRRVRSAGSARAVRRIVSVWRTGGRHLTIPAGDEVDDASSTRLAAVGL